MLKRILYGLLTALVVIGLWRGISNYSQDTGTNPISKLFSAIINAVQDITYRWVPDVINFFAISLPNWFSTW